MLQSLLPIEAIAGMWELICLCGTLLAAATAWILAPR